MKRHLQSILSIVLVVAIIITLIAVFGKQDDPVPTIQEVPKEEIFTKTIHDFSGCKIEQLTDEEDSNFVVFAEGVKEIVLSKDTNILVETDYTELSYTFHNADETLKSLKKGDVIYGRTSQWNPEGVAAKVKKIKISGDVVTVYSQPIGLADVFVYADIYTEVSLSGAYFDAEQLDEGSQIFINNQPGANARSGKSGSSSQSNGAEANIQNSKSKSELQSIHKDINVTFSHSLNIKKAGSESELGSTSIPTNNPISIDSSAARGIEFTGTLSTTLDSITVEWRFDRETLQFYCGAWADISTDDFLQLSAYGQIAEQYAFPTLTIPVQNLLLSIKIDTRIHAEASGSISGSVHRTQTTRYGAKASVSPAGVKTEPINTVVKPLEWEGSLGEMEAALSVGLELKPSIQFGFIGRFFISGDGTLTLSGSYAPLESVVQEKEPDRIHDCSHCIDGDINVAGKLDAGIEVKLASNLKDFKISEKLQAFLKKEKDGLEQLHPSLTILKINTQAGDFYISTMDEKTTFDFTECPNFRYKTTVNLVDEKGDAVGGAAVTADFGDGKTVQVTADEKGVATIYLPRGEASINATHNTQFVNTTVDVQYADTVELLMEKRVLYIELQVYFAGFESLTPQQMEAQEQQYQKLRDIIATKYPDAIFYREMPVGFRPEDDALWLHVSSSAQPYAGKPNPDAFDNISVRVYHTKDYYDDYWVYGDHYGSLTGGYLEDGTMYGGFNSFIFADESLSIGDGSWDDYYDVPHFSAYYTPPCIYLGDNIDKNTAESIMNDRVTKAFPFIDLWLSGKWNYDDIQNTIIFESGCEYWEFHQ